MLQAEHLDEGTLHAFLDGELDSDQMAEVERHLADCTECHRQADEARSMLHEADDLIDRLDPPPFVVLPEGGAMGGGGLKPVVLMPPEPETPRPVRPFAPPGVPRRWRAVGWAAGLVLVAGTGWLVTRDRGADAARDVRLAQSEALPEATTSGFERSVPQATAPAAPGPFAADSPSTLARVGESAAIAGADAAGDAPPSADQETAADPPREELAARTEPEPAASVERDAQEARQREAARRASEQRADAQRAAAERAERDVANRTQALLEQGAAPAGGAAAAARPAPPPDPMTALERRAGVYSRIGLDEAQRMLGGPAHAIADLRPQFVGLAPSGGLPGADPGRPVVRAVYLDPSQRLIMLDQQRQSGELPESTPNRIIMARGGVRLWLHGAVPEATLRALAERVR